MTSFGLTDREREMICDVPRRLAGVMEAKIFGSRAKGNIRPNSDIDLALGGTISRIELGTIVGELEEVPLPYLFDVELYDSLHYQALREHIDRVGKKFYVRVNGESSGTT